ncbi:hypothetical protein D3C76_1765020 [compost metagenome]
MLLIVHDFKALHVKRLITGKRRIHRVGVNARHFAVTERVKLRQGRAAKRLAYTAFALEHHVDFCHYR